MNRKHLLSRRVTLTSASWYTLAGLAAVGAACRRQGTAREAAREPAAPPQPVEIRVANRQPEWTPYWEKLLPWFTERTKITVSFEHYPDWAAKLLALFTSGTGPDAAHSNSHLDTKFYDAGFIRDLTPLAAREKLDLDRDYTLMGTEKWCGKIFALPYFSEPFAIYYNKSLVQQLGLKDPWEAVKGDWTWDDLLEMCTRVTRDTDGDGKVDQWGMIWPWTPPGYFGPIPWTRGTDFVDWDAMRYRFDNPIFVDSVRLFQKWLMQDNIFMTGPQQSAAQQQYSKNAFQAGRALFWFRSVTDIPRNRTAIDTSFVWDMLPVPKLDNSRPGVSLTAGHPNWMSAQTTKMEAAWRFLLWMSGPEVQGDMARTKFLMPALKSFHSVFLTTAPGEPPEHITVFGDVFRQPHGWHFRHHNGDETNALWSRGMNRILGGEVPLQQGLRDLQEEMNRAVIYGDCTPYRGLRHPIRPAG